MRNSHQAISIRPRPAQVPTADRTGGTPPAPPPGSREHRPVPAAPSPRRRSSPGPASRRLAVATWSLSILVVAVAAGYVAWRDPARYAGAARQVAWDIREALTPSPPLADSEARIDAGRDGYFWPTLRYPLALTAAIERADREGRDILADFGALEAAWRLECGDQPLILTFVHPTRTEPYTGRRLGIAMDSPHRVTEANFHEVVPLLREIRTLVLDADASGRGILPMSGYHAEPGPDAPDDPDRSSAPTGR